MNITVTLFVLAVFFFKCFSFIDPDFGWHFKMGELIFKSGIPKTDPFSYTMPSFPFVDHEWLTNVIFYHIYQIVGMLGIALLFAIIALAALLVAKSQNEHSFFTLQNKSKFSLVPFLLACSVLFPFLGARPQVETWLLTAILLKVVMSDHLWVKLRWFAPVYFLLWANLHGGFVVGLAILILFLSLKSLIQRKIPITDLVLALFCIGATLLNPYGFNLWKEVWQQLSDNRLHSAIAEWASLLFSFNWALLTFIPLAALSGFLIYRYRSKLTPVQISLYIFLLLLSLFSQRHTPLWVLVALPLTSQTLGLFYQDISPVKVARDRFNKVYKIFLVISFSLLVLEAIFYIKDLEQLREENFYPQQAVQFLKQHLQAGRVFSSYNWGGYLIWKLPEQEVFIDGRMPSWRWKTPLQQESSAAFDEYNQALSSIDGLKVLDRYQVRLVLWPKITPIRAGGAQSIQSWEQMIQAKFLSYPVIPSFEKRLEQAKWHKIYEDQVAVIYERPDIKVISK